MATFELEQLTAADGELVVRGHWSDVRGMRFVRPALIIDGRQVLATLEHKPWPPDAPMWTAAFPWEGATPAGDVALAVAPSVTVALRHGPPQPEPAGDPALERRRAEEEIGFLRKRLDALGEERDALVRQRDHARDVAAEHRDRADALQAEPPPAPRAYETPPAAVVAPSPSLEAEADALRRERASIERERERAAAQLAEAVAGREAAIRSRDRIAAQHEQALDAVADAQGQRDAAIVERDAAYAQLARTGEQPAVPASVTRRGTVPARPLDVWLFRVVAVAGVLAAIALLIGAVAALT